MVFELFQIILQACTTVLVAACLLLTYLHYLKINIAPNSGNPLGQFLLPMTNWLVSPLRRLIPFGGRIDVCTLVASYLLVVAKTALLLFIHSFDEWDKFFFTNFFMYYYKYNSYSHGLLYK